MLQLSIFADARALQMHLELGTLCPEQFQGDPPRTRKVTIRNVPLSRPGHEDATRCDRTK
jgi:hypothetical protein